MLTSYLDDVHHHNLSERSRLYILKKRAKFCINFLPLYYSMDPFLPLVMYYAILESVL